MLKTTKILRETTCVNLACNILKVFSLFSESADVSNILLQKSCVFIKEVSSSQTPRYLPQVTLTYLHKHLNINYSLRIGQTIILNLEHACACQQFVIYLVCIVCLLEKRRKTEKRSFLILRVATTMPAESEAPAI